jgi:hypothetical protein
MIDVYRVIELFEVTHPALQHALKKILAAVNRGAKDWERDVREAVDSLHRALQMRAEDCNKVAQPSDDPHAELRKTWKPGQRWQACVDGVCWCDLHPRVAPSWARTLLYRRHPDDAQEGEGRG